MGALVVPDEVEVNDRQAPGDVEHREQGDQLPHGDGHGQPGHREPELGREVAWQALSS